MPLVIPDPVKIKIDAPARPERIQAGAAILPGQVCYGTGSLQLAQADDEATSGASFMVITEANASGDQVVAFRSGLIRFDGVTILAGTEYCLSTTVAGQIVAKSELLTGNRLVYVGLGRSGNWLDLRFEDTGIVLP